ncbi:F-box protein At4g22390 [Linum grandiflorum]
MSADLIPQEITANILLRLRAKDLVKCRRVSKQWLSIIEDPQFIRSQLCYSLYTKSSNSAIFVQDRISYAASDDISSSTPPTYYDPTLKLQLMGSCHGLVCFCLFNYPHDFVIVNPSTGEEHTPSNPTKEARVVDTLTACGFGYDELSDDYKVVRILHTRSAADPRNRSYIAEIYGVRSKGFCRITIPVPTATWWRPHNIIGVFFGGSLHWCSANSDNPSVREHAIHAIDLVSNTYRQLHLPVDTFGKFRVLDVGIVDRCLCVCGFLMDEGKIDLWVMEEYGNLESWNRIYSVPCHNDYSPWALTFVGSIGENIMLIINCKHLAWFDPTKKNADGSVCFTKFRYISDKAICCLESLVKIFSNDAYDQ